MCFFVVEAAPRFLIIKVVAYIRSSFFTSLSVVSIEGGC